MKIYYYGNNSKFSKILASGFANDGKTLEFIGSMSEIAVQGDKTLIMDTTTINNFQETETLEDLIKNNHLKVVIIDSKRFLPNAEKLRSKWIHEAANAQSYGIYGNLLVSGVRAIRPDLEDYIGLPLVDLEKKSFKSINRHPVGEQSTLEEAVSMINIENDSLSQDLGEYLDECFLNQTTSYFTPTYQVFEDLSFDVSPIKIQKAYINRVLKTVLHDAQDFDIPINGENNTRYKLRYLPIPNSADVEFFGSVEGGLFSLNRDGMQAYLERAEKAPQAKEERSERWKNYDLFVLLYECSETGDELKGFIALLLNTQPFFDYHPKQILIGELNYTQERSYKTPNELNLLYQAALGIIDLNFFKNQGMNYNYSSIELNAIVPEENATTLLSIMRSYGFTPHELIEDPNSCLLGMPDNFDDFLTHRLYFRVKGIPEGFSVWKRPINIH